MALSATYDSRLNKSYGLDSAFARGLQIAVGTLAVTYSGAGGFTWTAPFNTTVFVSIPPQSGYVFTYNATTTVFKAYQTSTTASVMVEVASDTDFTALTDSLRFVAFGF